MPYGVYDYNTVDDAWKNGSVMDMVNSQVAQPTQTAPQPAPQNTEGIVQPSVQNLQQPNNSVFNQTHRAETPQPVPTQPTTQIATQGMGRRPTLQDYQAFALDYLAKKGYDYDEAMELMRPEFQAYAVREQAQNQALADDLIGRMQGMDIASPEYRQAAFQLYRLDPKMGQFMLKEGIGPRELYLQNQKREDAATARQQKREDMQFNADLQIENKLRWLKAQDAYTQQRYANMAQQYINAGYSPKEAWAFAMGGSRGKGATVGGGVSAADYKRATEGLKALMQKIDEKRLEDPSYQLSPEEQQQYNWLYAIKQKGDNEFYQRNGINTQPQQKQKVKLNPNDYYSFGPVLQDMVRMNGGMSKDVARAMRAALGFDPDDNSPNNFVNQVMKEQYGFSG